MDEVPKFRGSIIFAEISKQIEPLKEVAEGIQNELAQINAVYQSLPCDQRLHVRIGSTVNHLLFDILDNQSNVLINGKVFHDHEKQQLVLDIRESDSGHPSVDKREQCPTEITQIMCRTLLERMNIRDLQPLHNIVVSETFKIFHEKNAKLVAS